MGSKLVVTWADRTHAAWSQWAVYKAAHEQHLGAAVNAARAAGVAL